MIRARNIENSLSYVHITGLFYLQEDTKAPIIPVLLMGNYELWPPKRVFPVPGRVVINYLDVLPTLPASETYKSDVSKQLRARFAEELPRRSLKWSDQINSPLAPLDWAKHFAVIILFWSFCLLAMPPLVSAISSFFNVSLSQFLLGSAIYSSIVTIAVFLYAKA